MVLLTAFSPLALINFNLKVYSVSFETPLWLKEGTYAEYKFKSTAIEFTNFSYLDFDDGDATGIFRWECLDIRNNIATLNLTLTWGGDGTFKMDDHIIGSGFRVFKWSKIVYVDLQSNTLRFSNGTLIGPFLTWLPPRLEKGTTLEMFTNPNFWSGNYCITYVAGNVTSDSRAVTEIAHGPQKAFSVRWKIHFKLVIRNKTKTGETTCFYDYDWDTGLALTFDGGPFDPLFTPVFGMCHLGVMGLFPRLSATNIDLGPRVIAFSSWFCLIFCL